MRAAQTPTTYVPFFVGMFFLSLLFTSQYVNAQSIPESHSDVSVADTLEAVKADNERMRRLFPSQSHAMMDVSYHFTNLWFAGQRENWPLADFYLKETRNHIKWAIRLAPVRKSKTGEVKLQEIFDAFDSANLTRIEAEIAAKDRKKFSAAYRDALGGCNDCHTKSDKPYLRVIVPDKAEAHGIDFSPERGK